MSTNVKIHTSNVPHLNNASNILNLDKTKVVNELITNFLPDLVEKKTQTTTRLNNLGKAEHNHV